MQCPNIMLMLSCVIIGSSLECVPLAGVDVTVDGSAGGRQQTIDGFGIEASSQVGDQAWYQQLAYDDLGSSITRIDLTPQFVAPYSANAYNSPSYGVPGIAGTYCRSYSSAADYAASWNGYSAPIAVMGPDITQNLSFIDWTNPYITVQAAAAAAGNRRATALGDFKVYGTVFSPSPWLKVASGNTIGNPFANGPDNAPWPFIWLGQFAGGNLDTSGAELALFDDGNGPTSALTQWARTIACMVKGYQDHGGFHFYGISLQNEVNFEEFYNSCAYPLSSQYISMVTAVRAEFDSHPDLAGVRIVGPEDLLGSDGYGMWQYGSGVSAVHKNLQYLQNIHANPAASAAISFFCVHGYDANGATSAGADPVQWTRWSEGWSASPAAGVPPNIPGFVSYGKKSWMTETSGEDPHWLSPASGFPSNGAFSIALKLHQALTAGRESAWLYLALSDGTPVNAETLSDSTALASSPKYVSAKHFFKFIRPGSVRLATTSTAADLLASAYVGDASGTLTVVLVNGNPAAQTVALTLWNPPAGITSMQSFTSDAAALWQVGLVGVSGASLSVTVPGYGVVTLTGEAPGISSGSTGGSSTTSTGSSSGTSTTATTTGGVGSGTGTASTTGSSTSGTSSSGNGSSGSGGGNTASPSSSSGGSHCGLGGALAVMTLLVIAYRRRPDPTPQ